MIVEHDHVALTNSQPDLRLKPGDVGVIACLDATRDEFLANLEKTRQHVAGKTEGGVLAGKEKRDAKN
jgi:hypothetical protein